MGRNGTGWKRASDTSYEITFAYKGQRCRERIKLKPSASNDRKIEHHRSAVIDAIEKGTFDYAYTFPESTNAAQFAARQGDIILIKDYLDQWLRQAEAHVSASTWNGYRKIINNTLIPALGHLKLTELRRRHIKEMATGMSVTNKRIANILSPLRVAMQEATDDELIDTNPLYGWQYKRKEGVKQADDIDPFTSEEQTAILEALTGQGRNLIQFAFWSGLRTSELVALEWGDIDWKRGVVRIQRAQTQAAAEPETTKTRAGIREIKILSPALQALKAQKTHSYLHPSGRVFLNPRTGAAWTGDQPIRKTLWEHALKKAQVRYRRPYQTRHTYASMMLSAGESPMWVAQQMGHSDWTMIARVYGRWIPDAAPEAGDKAVAIFAVKDNILPTSKAK